MVLLASPVIAALQAAPQRWLASYFAMTCAGIRPRSLTSMPLRFAHARISALRWRCAAVLRFGRDMRVLTLRALSANRFTASSNFWLC